MKPHNWGASRRLLRLWIDNSAPLPPRSVFRDLTGLDEEALTEYLLREVLNHCHAKYGTGPASGQPICGRRASPETLLKMRMDAKTRRAEGRRDRRR